MDQTESIRVRQITDKLIPGFDQLIDLLPPNISLIYNCGRIGQKVNGDPSQYGLHVEKAIIDSLEGRPAENLPGVPAIVKRLNRMPGIWVPHQELYTKNRDLSGHPDLCLLNRDGSLNGIYDIKTTIRFNNLNMKHGSILQMCAYTAIARECCHAPQKIGIILPQQGTVLEYYFTTADWDHVPFLKLLLQTAEPLRVSMDDMFELQALVPHIGSHISKGQSIALAITNFCAAGPRPCQIFLQGNVTARDVVIPDADISAIRAAIATTQGRVYTHAPYCINLCHTAAARAGRETTDWGMRALVANLRESAKFGGSGVVVHTGKGLELSREAAYTTMQNSIILALDHATPQCPLLLETPCDKGSELCGTLDELINVYHCIARPDVFGICIDTCHVFAAGHDPFDYIMQFASACPGAIKLIHLNDSQWAKGSGHDGHAPIGRGLVGLKTMLNVINWAIINHVDMVTE